jgi:transketolase
VAECLSDAFPVRIKRLGIDDRFGQSGEPDELLAHYGLSVHSIVEAARALSRH